MGSNGCNFCDVPQGSCQLLQTGVPCKGRAEGSSVKIVKIKIGLDEGGHPTLFFLSCQMTLHSFCSGLGALHDSWLHVGLNGWYLFSICMCEAMYWKLCIHYHSCFVTVVCWRRYYSYFTYKKIEALRREGKLPSSLTQIVKLELTPGLCCWNSQSFYYDIINSNFLFHWS